MAIENLDEILEVDHVDMYLVAVGDLAQSMGLPGQPEHPEVDAVRDEAFARIVDAGKVAGAVTRTWNVETFLSQGVRFITTPVNDWLTAGAQAYLDAVAKALK